MKKILFYLFGVALLTAFHACSDNDSEQDDSIVPDKQQAIDAIVKVLEARSELSDFKDWFSAMNLSSISETQFTVFAPRNDTGNGTSFDSRAETLNGETVERHVVIGSYTKDQLTEGTVLKTVNGESVYVTRSGEEVQVNGIPLVGDAISAGQSKVYVIEEPLEERLAAYYVTIVEVRLLTKGNPESAPLEGVTVTGYDEDDNVIGTCQTGADGKATVEHVQPTLYYTISKDGYADKDNGWLVAGVDDNGNYIYVDANGDGILNLDDQVTSKYSIYHGDTEVEAADDPLYMIPVEQPSESDRIVFSEESQSYASEGIRFGAASDNETLYFTTNQMWSVEMTSNEWCTVSPVSGSVGNGSFTVSVTENTEDTDRSTSITLTAGTASQTLRVMQKGKEVEPENPSDVTSGNEGYGEDVVTWD